MKDTCTQSTVRDFRQRYQNTIASFIKEDGSKEWVYINEVNDDSVLFTNKGGQAFSAVNDKNIQFEFTQVPMGWFNTPKGPVFFCRRPARQWQRGISRSNTNVYNASFRTLEVSLTLIESAFTFNKPWDRNTTPWAFNKFFCIGDKNIMYFYDTQIGFVDKGKIFVANGCPVLQELQDTIRRMDLPYTVEMENE